MEDDPRMPAEKTHDDPRRRPPGDFTSEELQEDTARFLDELRRRADHKKRRAPLRKSGPPPPAEPPS
jgi:hypothetical protein